MWFLIYVLILVVSSNILITRNFKLLFQRIHRTHIPHVNRIYIEYVNNNKINHKSFLLIYKGTEGFRVIYILSCMFFIQVRNRTLLGSIRLYLHGWFLPAVEHPKTKRSYKLLISSQCTFINYRLHWRRAIVCRRGDNRIFKTANEGNWNDVYGLNNVGTSVLIKLGKLCPC